MLCTYTVGMGYIILKQKTECSKESKIFIFIEATPNLSMHGTRNARTHMYTYKQHGRPLLMASKAAGKSSTWLETQKLLLY